jgi:hypothetical protein
MFGDNQTRHVSVLGSLDIRQQYVGDQLDEDHPHIDGYVRRRCRSGAYLGSPDPCTDLEANCPRRCVETTLMLVRIWNAADFRYGRAPEGSPPSNTFPQRRHVR